MRNLTRKLFLSICTLAICAVTLVSTTFAWYTTNTEVSSNAVGGTADAATSDSTLLVSNTDATTAVWSSVVTPTEKSESSSLEPLQFTSSTLKKLNVDASVAENDYFLFTIYFKTTKTPVVGGTNEDIPVYIKNITLTNTTPEDTVAPINNLLYGVEGVTSGAPADPVYSVDMIRALNMFTYTAKSTEEFTALNITSHVDLTGVGTLNDYEEVGHSTSMNAHDYYEKIMGPDTLDDNGTSGASALTKTKNQYDQIEIGKLKYTSGSEYDTLAVTFVIYLDGWDTYCYDACRGQSFAIALSFTTMDDAEIGTVK